MVIDPGAFVGAPAYLAEVKRFAAHVRKSRPLPGPAAIRLPGERGFAAMRDAVANGVPVEDHMREKLDELGKKYRLGRLD